MKTRTRLILSLAGLTACAAALAAVWPQARQATAIFVAQDDPATLSELQVRRAAKADPALVEREIELALADGDADLAGSFVDLAAAQEIPLSSDQMSRVSEAVAQSQSVSHLAGRFATGFLTGDVSDVASFGGTVAGDLFTFGDVRDLVREGHRLATGAEADSLVLGLAAIGLAVTAGTYASAGTASPARAGLSLFKGARKSARLSAGLTDWARRSASEIVDPAMLRRAAGNVSLMRPLESAGAIKAAVRTEKAGMMVAALKDVGQVGRKAGARTALDVVKIADNPKDLARAARLAESKGSQTRAIFKILGRGALLLTAGAFQLASWIFSALLFIAGLVVSIKSLTERLTFAWLRRARERRLRNAAAGARA